MSLRGLANGDRQRRSDGHEAQYGTMCHLALQL
jgi:hypothetical protein